MRGRRAAAWDGGPVEGPWDLPDGWRWERLGNCLPLEYGKALSAKNRSPDGVHPVFGSSGAVGTHDATLTTGPTVVVGRKGSAGAVHYSATGCWPIDTAYYVRPRPDMDLRYAFHLLTHLRLGTLDQSTAIPSLSRDNYSELIVPIADEELQPRLAARIDTLFAEIDEGEAALAEARAGVETYRKALLKSAVTGELTAEWRRDNPPQETGEQLLQRILADRRARWHADPKNARKKYTEPARPDTDGLPELPEGWAWASLAQLLSGIEAGLNVKAHGRPPAEGETGIVKVSAVTWDEFDEDQSKALFLDTKIDERNLITVDDLLISRANTIELVGAPAIVRNLNKRLFLSDKILRLIVPWEFKEWLYFVLKSPFGRHHIESRSTGNQLSMRNISQDGLRALPVPIPPAEELEVLLDMLHGGWREQRFLSQWLAENSASSTLRQSILAAAFRGEFAHE